ncbi:MAG: DNA translocase FtsK [Bacteroidota bacterium]
MPQHTYKKQVPDHKQPARFAFTGAFSGARRFEVALGIFLQGATVFLGIAFVSHFLHGSTHVGTMEAVQQLGFEEAGVAIHNWMGLVGGMAAYYFVFRWLGITAFFLLIPLYALGHRLVYQKLGARLSLHRVTGFALFGILWLNLALGYANLRKPEAKLFDAVLGGLGLQVSVVFDRWLGWGTLVLLVTSLLIFLVYYGSLLPSNRLASLSGLQLSQPGTVATQLQVSDGAHNHPDLLGKAAYKSSSLALSVTPTATVPDKATKQSPAETGADPPPSPVGQQERQEALTGLAENYDPTLELASYQYPTLDLLDAHAQTLPQVTPEELAQNKERIVQTLVDFKIDIASIKATIGPTVTLYEIVPAAGIKIAKIKSLEDDIALSLAALGIRIIAPIPGRGTIGIEVPNKHRAIVSLRDMLASDKFMESLMDLPIILGKTIDNEVVVADLARMPHLLIAGSTGQGKSVGLNVLLASLVYKQHPSLLKLVLVDPKKVEFSLYAKLERHFLAKLPGSEEPIITEPSKAVNTLHSLCLEMEARYELLKEAGARNIKEYNEKFVQRRLNPARDHRFFPYIVLVIDEFADMMMTAGKEVEAPIARLAQLARAVGIYLVLATQRPSVNVITGIIKANFPVRISFKVTSAVDSRTILDTSGAEQLVGQGDMLLSMDSALVRLQCPLLDTAAVERICGYISAQQGYDSAYLLPAYEEDDKEAAVPERGSKDPAFEEAARLVVMHQQGSTSLIQRKLKLGYNRAGRLIDQLEAAGIVGSFEGSKAREVLLPDEDSLELFLKNLAQAPSATSAS